jgi:cysteine-rich repeat protein
MKHLPTAMLGLVLMASSGLALAVTGQGGHSLTAEPELEVALRPPARAYPVIQWHRAPAASASAWKAFVTGTGGQWHAMWDAHTGVPRRIWGSGPVLPGVMDSPALAERHARALLFRHIDLLAPGARAEDFTVVSNHLGEGMRTIGMVQHHRGMPVLGGQVSFRFKNDRLFVIGSEALPLVSAPPVHQSLDMERAHQSALAWMRDRAATVRVSPDAPPGGLDPLVLPIVRPGGVTYHTVVPITIEARAPLGRWHVYMDALTGEPVARTQVLRFAEGTVHYRVPERYPRAGYVYEPARDATLTVNGLAALSSDEGVVSWPVDEPVGIRTSVTGPRVRVVNDAGDEAADTFTLAPGGTLQWDASTSEHDDAQLSAFVHSRVVKDYCRGFAPDLGFLDQELLATVNIDDQCNAFSDGTTINFYGRSRLCENTGLLPDVVYHEFGHALHMQSIIPGVGAFDGAFSEGLADYLAASITGDPGVGRGFFHNDAPLRHIDPDDHEARWPEDVSAIHETGLIFAGAMWDLRKALIEAHGPEAGVALANRLFYAAVQRAVDIPSSYVEVLAADDDDGDLSNGTPNECLINYTFGSLHGLRALGIEISPIGAQPPGREGYEVSLQLWGASERCPGDAVAAVTLYWGLRDEGQDPGQEEALPGSITLDAQGDLYTGTIPGQQDGVVVRYRIEVELADGGIFAFPTNLADRAYEFYVGELVELYCTDFETDVFASGEWNRATFTAASGDDEWQWGTPAGRSADPAAAFSGARVIGTRLGASGDSAAYRPNQHSIAQSPIIDVGNFSDVRLQYRRWLTVEDALYDQATIHANSDAVWRNLDTSQGSIHHLDAEWVFHDVPLSRGVHDGTVQVTFELRTDAGLEFGGFNLDDVCIVANPRSICGDGVITGAEDCDEGVGNSDTAIDACRTNCRLAACGDGVVDTGEACDDGNNQDGDGCSSVCALTEGEGCGCTVGRTQPGGVPLALLCMAGIALAWRRSRRAASRRE